MPKLTEGYAAKLVVPPGKRDVQVFDDALPGFFIRKFESGRASYGVKFNVGTTTAPHPRCCGARRARRDAQEGLRHPRQGPPRHRCCGCRKDRRSQDDRDPGRSRAQVSRCTRGRRRRLQQAAGQEFYRGRALPAASMGATARAPYRCHHPQGHHHRGGRPGAPTAAWRPTAPKRPSPRSTSGIEAGFADSNPTIGVRNRATDGPRKRKLTEAELVEVWLACEDAGEFGQIVRCSSSSVKGAVRSPACDGSRSMPPSGRSICPRTAPRMAALTSCRCPIRHWRSSRPCHAVSAIWCSAAARSASLASAGPSGNWTRTSRRPGANPWRRGGCTI